MNPVKCEFDDGIKHEADAEFIVSRRNPDDGKFNQYMHYCRRHFIDYAETLKIKEEIEV